MARARTGRWIVLGGALGALALGWLLWLQSEPAEVAASYLPAAAPPDPPAVVSAVATEPATPSAERRELMTAPPMPTYPARLEAAWEHALALHGRGQSQAALQLLMPFLEDYPSFFAEDTRAPVLAAMRTAAAEALKEMSPKIVLRELIEAALRGEAPPAFLGDEAQARLLRKVAASAQVVARLPEKKQREQMRRHLERFLIAGQASTTAGKEKAVGADALLQQLLDRAKERTKSVAPLPVAKPDETEARRLAQLDNLHKRDVIWLLDTIHAGLLRLVLHQGADGRFSDGAVAERIEQLTGATTGRKEETKKQTKEEKKEAKEVRRILRGLKKREGYAVSATALGIIALLDFRDQDVSGLFEPALARAVDWLVKQQSRDGSFKGRQYYTDAIALMALGQAAASSGSEPVKLAVERGLERLYKRAGPRGGYRYTSGQPGDLSVSGWVAQAIEMARLANAAIPEGMEKKLAVFLEGVWVEEHRYYYTYSSDRGSLRSTLFPVGMLMGQILTEEIEEDVLESWRTYLQKPDYRRRPDLYTLYYGVRMSILLEGKLVDPWRAWTKEVADAQFKEGPLTGAFPPDLSRWMRRSVTVVSTMALLSMEHALYLR